MNSQKKEIVCNCKLKDWNGKKAMKLLNVQKLGMNVEMVKISKDIMIILCFNIILCVSMARTD